MKGWLCNLGSFLYFCNFPEINLIYFDQKKENTSNIGSR